MMSKLRGKANRMTTNKTRRSFFSIVACSVAALISWPLIGAEVKLPRRRSRWKKADAEAPWPSFRDSESPQEILERRRIFALRRQSAMKPKPTKMTLAERRTFRRYWESRLEGRTDSMIARMSITTEKRVRDGIKRYFTPAFLCI